MNYKFKVGDTVVILGITRFNRKAFEASRRSEIQKYVGYPGIVERVFSNTSSYWDYYINIINSNKNVYVFEDQIMSVKEYEKLSDKNKSNVINLISI